MQIIRTIFWALLTGLLVAFVAINWTPVRVNVWPDSGDALGYIHAQWPAGLLVLVAFAMGWLPMWLLSSAGRWRLKRRIASLENAIRLMTPATTTGPDNAETRADAPEEK